MINIKLEGKEIAKSVVDLFSPLTEFVGAIGDQIRVYRELSVLRTLKRVKTIAKEEGLSLEPPPLKFLIPYLEQTSLEDENDEVLSELWARLLVSSATDYRPEHHLFIRILSELSPREAHAFQYIARNPEHNNYKGYMHWEDIEGFWDDSYIFITIRELFTKFPKQDLKSIPYKAFERCLKEEIQSPGSYLYYFHVVTGQKNNYPYDELYTPDRNEFDDLFDKTVFSMLKSLGLIGEYCSPEYWFDDIRCKLRAYYLTPLGGSFCISCLKETSECTSSSMTKTNAPISVTEKEENPI